MKKNKKGAIFFLTIVIVFSCIGFYRSCEVQNNGVYTIATTYNYGAARSGIGFDFKYTFEGKEHKFHTVGSKNNTFWQDEGKRFFIQVLADNPKRCFMTKIPVPDSIAEAPFNGWKDLSKDQKKASRDLYKPTDESYTIATIYDIEPMNNSAYVTCYYSYNFWGINYTNQSINNQLNINDKNKRYYVQVNMLRPDKHTLTPIPVPDNTSQIPADGWRQIPDKK